MDKHLRVQEDMRKIMGMGSVHHNGLIPHNGKAAQADELLKK